MIQSCQKKVGHVGKETWRFFPQLKLYWVPAWFWLELIAMSKKTTSKMEMDVSKNSGTPESSILIGFLLQIIHFGVPLFWKHPNEADRHLHISCRQDTDPSIFFMWCPRIGWFPCNFHESLLGGFNALLFLPRTLGKWSNLTNILQMGWNHQLEIFDRSSQSRRFRGSIMVFHHLPKHWAKIP